MNRITQLPPLPIRPPDGNKGTFGRVLVVGGNEEMVGAPVLAGTAALRTGSGLVQIAVAKNNLAASLSITPELIGLGLTNTTPSDKRLLDAAEKAGVIVLGPGLGQSPSASRRIEKLIKRDAKMVIDADALNYFATLRKWPKYFRAHAVLTPHPGEMKRLGKLLGISQIPSDDDGRIDVANRAAKSFAQVMILKGARTIVTDGDRVYINRTGNSALAKAGTGDVLSGVIGSLIGQGMNLFDAAIAGVWIHGKAGEFAGEKLGLRSALATDVIDALPAAISTYDRTAGE
jgi:ADP-dependent NAD(P)H-hydrate dehydratase